jgi:hypothetical protein
MYNKKNDEWLIRDLNNDLDQSDILMFKKTKNDSNHDPIPGAYRHDVYNEEDAPPIPEDTLTNMMSGLNQRAISLHAIPINENEPINYGNIQEVPSVLYNTKMSSAEIELELEKEQARVNSESMGHLVQKEKEMMYAKEKKEREEKMLASLSQNTQNILKIFNEPKEEEMLPVEQTNTQGITSSSSSSPQHILDAIAVDEPLVNPTHEILKSDPNIKPETKKISKPRKIKVVNELKVDEKTEPIITVDPKTNKKTQHIQGYPSR